MFHPRFKQPESGNKYYMRHQSGGYSGAILGKPTDAGCDVLANCVGYAAGRFCEIIGKERMPYFEYPPNAEDFFEAAKSQGLKTGTTPQLGAIVCWAKGKTHFSSDGAGHVAVVEKINSDGSIITSESGYNCSNPFWTTHREKGGGNWGAGSEYRFLGFIYQPDPVITRVLKKGCQGADVEIMQARLHALGYLRKSEIDGDFGTITLGAVCAFQLEHGLDVDGCCGVQTQKALDI